MKFEGTQVNIPINGIMRAGTDNLAADGAMNEVIGLEYKDGSFVPYGGELGDNKIENIRTSEIFENAMIVDFGGSPLTLYCKGWKKFTYSQDSSIWVHAIKWNTAQDGSGAEYYTPIEDGYIPSDVTTISNDVEYDVQNESWFFGWSAQGVEQPTITYVAQRDFRKIIGVRVHKTSAQENVVAILAPVVGDGATVLAWKSKTHFDDVDGTWKGLYGTDGVSEVEFVGNVLCANTDNGVVCFIFDGSTKKYEERNLDVTNLPHMSLRVTRGLYDKESPSENYVGKMSNNFKNVGSYSTTGAFIENLATLKSDLFSTKIGSGLLVKAKGLQTESGGLTGYFLACAAYRLKNGQYVAASAPVLLCPPLSRFRSASEQGDNLLHDYIIYTPDGLTTYPASEAHETEYPGTSLLPATSYMPVDAENFGILHGETTLSIKDEEKLYSDSDLSLYIAYPMGNSHSINLDVWYNDFIGSESPDPSSGGRVKMPTVFAPALNAEVWMDYNSSTDKLNSYQIVYGTSNKLEFRLSSNEISDDLIDGIGIFISEEISPFKEINDSNVVTHGAYRLGRLTSTSTATVDDMQIITTFTPKVREVKAIMDDIKSIKNLYLVKFISVDELEDTTLNTWLPVDLKGYLGDTLLTRPSISIDTLVQSTKTIGKLFAYNGRLHMFNYESEYGLDSSMVTQRYRESIAQLEEDIVGTSVKFGTSTAGSSNIYITGQIVVTSDIGDGNIIKQVYRVPNGEYYSTPIFAVKGVDVESIVLELRNLIATTGVGTSYYTAKIPLTYVMNKDLGIAYVINNDLLPFPLVKSGDFSWESTDEDGYNSFFTKESIMYTAKNGIRISDTYYPYYFENKSTVKVGNGEIIGMARLTMALSQDTYGSNPVLVFCTDGIYTLGVDASGNGAYTVITPFSREVCLNRNSICEIDGGVLFTSSKGLMVATSNGVKEFVPKLNGEPRHLPQNYAEEHGVGMVVYGAMIDNPQIVSLDDSISYDDFMDYLKDENTYISYVSIKNKVLVYNRGYEEVYWIDIPTQIVTKLAYEIKFDNGDYPSEEYYTVSGESLKFNYINEETRDCLLQSRPIKIASGMKTAYRVTVRGYMECEDNVEVGGVNKKKYAELLVLGSLDGDHWRPIGFQERKLSKQGQGMHGIMCQTDRVSCNYMMIIFAACLNEESYIDSIDITVEVRNNHKLSNVV